MDKKRGQMTVFILIGLVIFVFALLFYLVAVSSQVANEDKPAYEESVFDVNPVRVYLADCFRDLSNRGLSFIGGQGGYYLLPDEGVYAFYYSGGRAEPSLEEIELQLSYYLEDLAYSCLSGIRSYGFEINEGKPSAEAFIKESRVDINLDPDLIVNREGYSKKLERFSINIKDIRFYDIYMAAGEILSEIEKDPETICTSCITDIAEKHNLKISSHLIGGKKVLFRIKHRVKESSYPYTFKFLVELK